jgi:hypothetical protein
MAYCHSCSAPLIGEFKGASDKFCKCCLDETGNRAPRDAIQKGIAEWLMSWDEGLTMEKALVRAGHYMKAIPAWAED